MIFFLHALIWIGLSYQVDGQPAPTQNAASHFQAAQKEQIDWKKRRTLTWADFKAAPIASSPNAALTSTSILIQYRWDSDNKFEYYLACVFYPHKSWTKNKSDRILRHEQGHFDISQLFTRMLHKELSTRTLQSADVEKGVSALYQRVNKEQADFQKQYDSETNHSRNTEAQQQWEKKLAAMLQETAAWASYPQE